MRTASAVLLAAVLVAGLGIGAAFAYCGCESTCSGSGCDRLGEGGCWQTLYNRCDGGVCGNYDPLAVDCQYICEWTSYLCCHWLWGQYYCEHITSYDEFCITEG